MHRSWVAALLCCSLLVGCGPRLKPGANLRGRDLSQRDMSGAELSGADLSSADLTDATLSRADLSQARLLSARLTQADLSGADLSGANLSAADLSGANLESANLRGATLSRADLSGANLSETQLAGAVLDEAYMEEAVGLTTEMLLGAASLTGLQVHRLEDIRAALRDVCQGHGVPEAAPYRLGTTSPTIVVSLSQDEMGRYWSGWVPSSWVPAAIELTELVACVEESVQIIEVCRYSDGPDIHRVRYSETFRLVEAETGVTVASRAFRGPIPRDCRSTERFSTTTLGKSVDKDQVLDWLTSYVEE